MIVFSVKQIQNGRCTDGPSASVSVHVTVHVHRGGGTPRVDGVHPAGAGVVMAIDVITVDEQVRLKVRAGRGHRDQQGYQ